MPPLRERREDIPILAEHFLEKHAAQLGRRVTRDHAAKPWTRSTRLDFPGNVRELST